MTHKREEYWQKQFKMLSEALAKKDECIVELQNKLTEKEKQLEEGLGCRLDRTIL